ncbi:hypothetical protein TRFO_11762 [Tritrichomonas foetus]|uniref:Uncharacterized protein n=1 Tax=Tritrichomonas foetus TaxID=1144522 RepID=A0A1J4J231_9EUKA|nr:hypothetical protein TRFO_11762 [Tritrichomonas foetus]|eukprot:OHS93544.1 hypothetical protein TRFO_11762 [Tritrichomonas foetus]
MSWRKNSARNFQFDRPSTPYNVGPGSYEIEIDTPRKEKRAPSAAFKNREKRTTPFDRKRNTTPAPGKYDPAESDKTIKITSSFKTSSKRRVFDPTDNPSPADHSNLLEWVPKKAKPLPEKIVNRPYSQYVGQDISGFDILADGSLRPKKNKRKDERWLGPGSYNPEMQFGVVGHSMKGPYRNLDLASKEGVPGPGSYDTRDKQFHRPSTPTRPQSIGRARTAFSEFNKEAPKGGELKHQPWNKDEFSKSSAMFKSKSKREIFVVTEKTPSPTNYQNTERKRISAGKAAFGQRTPRFVDERNDVPGPGAYEAEDCMWITSTTPTGRHAHDVYRPGNGVPGPGSYEAPTIWKQIPEKHTSVFASVVPRDQAQKYPTPGPGAYTVETPRSTSKISIHASRTNKANNFFDIPTKYNPAPDSYNVGAAKLVKGRTISHDHRFADESKNTTPGPGTYKITHGSLIKKSFNSDLIGVS